MVYDTKGGMAGTVGRQALQGATFGFSDELIDTVGYAGAKAYAKAFAPELLDEITFKEARQSSKQDIARDWQNAPVTSFASQAAGSIPFGLTKAAGNVANWASGGGKLMSAAKGGAVGAGYGGLAGVGAGEDSVSDRLKSGGFGASLGFGLGAALSPLSRYLQSTVKSPNQSDISAKSVKSLPKGATKAQKYMAEMLAKRPDIANQLARAEAMDAASKASGINLTFAEKLAQSSADPLLLQQAKLGSNPQTAGMMEKFYSSRSGTPNQAGQIENALMNKVRELSPNTQNYDDLSQMLIDRAGQKTKEITGKLSNEAGKFYDSAYKANKSVKSPLLDRLLETPAGASALSQARTTFLNNRTLMGVTDPDLFEQAALTGTEIPKGGISSGLKLQTFDEVKKALDGAIAEEFSKLKAGQPPTEYLRSLMNVKNNLVSELDRLDVTSRAGPNSFKIDGGDYAKARGIYSGQPDKLLMRQQIGNLADIDPMNAKQVGSQLFSGTQQNAQMTAQALGPEGAKQAAAARLLNVMDTARGEPQTWASKIAPDQRTKEMLDIYAGKGQFDDLLNVINQAKIGDRYKYGSPTEPLKSADKALEGAANAGIDLVSGNKIGLLRKVAGVFGKGNPEDNPEFYQEMADLMTTDKGMDLLRQVANGNQQAVQVLQSGSLMKRGAMTTSPYLSQNPISRAAVGGVNAPQVMQEQIIQQQSYDPYSDPELVKIMQGGSYDPYKAPELIKLLRSK